MLQMDYEIAKTPKIREKIVELLNNADSLLTVEKVSDCTVFHPPSFFKAELPSE